MIAQGRVALVTGGARRLGATLSRALGALGARVAVHVHESHSEADALVRALQAEGVEAAAFRADLRDPDACEALAQAVTARLGPPAIVVHGAASFHRAPLLGTAPAELEAVLRLNLMAPILLTRALAPGLRAQGGLVVLMADLAGEQGWVPYGAHSVARAGLMMACGLLAQELAPEARVNAIAPGEVLPAPGQPPRLGKIPLGRVGAPEDVARALVYLVESDYVSGELLHVDGGRHARRT